MDNMDIHYLFHNDTAVRCHNCATKHKVQKRVHQVCKACDKRPGLCSEECFNSYHLANGFELIAAAVKKPGDPTQCDRSKDPSLHYVVHKPPTELNETPRGKCKYCSMFKIRKDSYLQCNFCCIPFCNQEHLMKHHIKKQILDIPEPSSAEEVLRQKIGPHRP